MMTPRNLQSNDIHLWLVNLDQPGVTIERLRSALSQEEISRATKYYRSEDQNRSIARYGILRQVLSGYLGCPPASLTFSRGPNGKPALRPGQQSGQVHFSLAHSEGMALYGFTRAAPIGVDLERRRVIPEADLIVAQRFSPAEIRLYQELDPAQRNDAFLRGWVCKEAYLKAEGAGIGQGIDFPRIRLGDTRDFSAEDCEPFPGVYLEFNPSPDFQAAICCASAVNLTVTCFRVDQWPAVEENRGVADRGVQPG